MNNRIFRDAMGKFTTGITIVTTEHKEEIVGMTVNAFMSVSLEPKLIAISIDKTVSMYPKLLETKQFGLSILKEEQKYISMVYAKQIEKQEVDLEELDGIPVIKDALVQLSCYVQDTIEAGDHTIFIAEVSELTMDEGNPTLYYSGAYREIKSKE